MKKILNIQFVRYLIAGGLATLAYLLASNGASLLFTPWWANAIGFIVGMVAGYFLQWSITFRTQRSHMKMFSKFAILNGILFVYSQSLTVIGTKVFHLPYAIITLISATTVPLISYPLQKYWVYRHKKPKIKH